MEVRDIWVSAQSCTSNSQLNVRSVAQGSQVSESNSETWLRNACAFRAEKDYFCHVFVVWKCRKQSSPACLCLTGRAARRHVSARACERLTCNAKHTGVSNPVPLHSNRLQPKPSPCSRHGFVRLLAICSTSYSRKSLYRSFPFRQILTRPRRISPPARMLQGPETQKTRAPARLRRSCTRRTGWRRCSWPCCSSCI